MPKYSVIIPSHNEGMLLAQTVANVINAGVEDAEVVVVDDCSDDHSGEETAQLFQDQPVTVIFNNQRRGSAHARNDGVSYSSGEYLAFIDAHSDPETGWLERLGPVVDHTGGIVASRLRTLQVVQEGELYRLCRNPDGGLVQGATVRDATLEWGYPPPRPTLRPYPVLIAPLGGLMVRRDLFDELGGFDELLLPPWSGEDTDLSLRAWTAGHTVHVTPETTVWSLYRESFPYAGPTMTTVVHNRLRMAWKYLAADDLELVIEAHAGMSEFPAALAHLLEDVAAGSLQRPPVCGSEILERFGVVLG